MGIPLRPQMVRNGRGFEIPVSYYAPPPKTSSTAQPPTPPGSRAEHLPPGGGSHEPGTSFRRPRAPRFVPLTITESIEGLRETGLLPLVRAWCAELHVTLADVLGKGRTAHVAGARHEMMRRLRDRFGFSYPELGRIFRRDHTTVMVGVRRAVARGAPLASRPPVELPEIPDLFPSAEAG